MRRDPGTELVLKLLSLFELIGGFTQLDQEAKSFIVACACTAHHCLIDLLPVSVLVIMDLLQMSQAGHLLLLTLLTFQLGFDRLTFSEQRGVGDVLTR